MSSTVKAQDVLVALKLLTIGDEPWSFTRLAGALGLSVGATHNAVTHLRAAKLIYERRGQATLAKQRLLDFLVHGVPAVFYAVRGGIGRGMPTGPSAPMLADVGLVAATPDAVPMVWPVPTGKIKGETLAPIYETAPGAAAKDGKLYEFLALVDVVRTGGPRQRKLAAELLEARVMASPAEQADEGAA